MYGMMLLLYQYWSNEQVSGTDNFILLSGNDFLLLDGTVFLLLH